MSDARELYQEVILDHNKKPRNYFAMEGANHIVNGNNPLCGDKLTLFLKIDGDHIADASFQGNGCAISKSSASLMTSAIKGKPIREAETLLQNFLKMITGEKVDEADLGKLVVFSGVCEFPVRVKCASLAWRTLESALHNKESTVTTE